MSVAFQTIAKIAPTGREVTIWAYTDAIINSGIPISWSDNTGLTGLWQQPNPTYTGDIWAYMASNTIKVPASKAGDVKITADAGTYGTQDITIKFEDWGDSPDVKDVLTDAVVAVPQNQLVQDPSAAPSDITYLALLTKTDGTAVGTGGEVQFFVSPQNGVASAYVAGTATKAPAAKGGVWYPVLTDSTGFAKLTIRTSRSMAVSLQARSPGVQREPSGTGWFAWPDDPQVPAIWNAPYTQLDEGKLTIAAGARTFALREDNALPPKWANGTTSAFLYVSGNGKDIPWSINDTTNMTAGYAFDGLPLADVKLSEVDLEANNTLFFLQQQNGSITKSGTFSFGTKGSYTNQPDFVNFPPSSRPFNTPVPCCPNPGLGGYITPELLNSQNPPGLRLNYNFALPASYTTGKVVFNFYLNGQDRFGSPMPRFRTVPAVEAVAVTTTSYHAVLDYADASGYFPPYGLFWAEMAWVPPGEDSNISAWIYSQANSYILATGEAI